MNKPCEHCNTADKERQGYFKCGSPCNQAKMCYESDKKIAEIFHDAIKKGAQKNGI